MKLTAQDEERRRQYVLCTPKFLGNLHERMKCVMDMLDQESESVSHELWQALFDLEIEVSYHEPQTPPYGHRLRGRKANA